ncbi:hypothetical protein [Euzebya sp.]|uniref:hypothetical protein n=1 Tax=Euzebya sp. TaxID=1971409 RepID=UPI003515F8A7
MGSSPSPQAVVAAIASRQAGHVAVWQCRLVGLSGSWVSLQVELRGWIRVHRGVYRVGGVPESPLGRIWAAVLAVSDLSGPDRVAATLAEGTAVIPAAVRAAAASALVTGLSAAWLRGCDVAPPRVTQLLVDPGTQSRREIRLVRSLVPTAQVEVVHRLRLAPPVRMLWDVAWVLRKRSRAAELVGDLAVDLDRRRRLAVDELVGAVDEPVLFELPPRVPGQLRRAAELLRPGFSHSRTEALVREMAVEIGGELGLEVAMRPTPIRSGGRIIAEADIAVPEIRWDIEVDGPHHRAPSMRRRDGRRDLALGVIDWATSRYDTDLVDEDRAGFAGLLRTDFHAMVDRAAA